jgi:disulfide bond formation protein DsbB
MSTSIAPIPPTEVAPQPRTGVADGWAWVALVVSVAGLIGSLFLSLGMNLKACPLCFYQRTFMMSLVAVLTMGLVTGAVRPGRLGLLALPLAVAGLSVALFHVSLELRGKLECPAGVFGLGTAPQQSLAVFLALTGLLTVDLLSGPRGTARSWFGLTAAVVLGALLGFGSTVANPPPPAAPTQPYATPPEVCRPPYYSS